MRHRLVRQHIHEHIKFLEKEIESPDAYLIEAAWLRMPKFGICFPTLPGIDQIAVQP
ncbi:MAG: hypothetical protein ACRERS_11280 [Methylococcales bacterium]